MSETKISYEYLFDTLRKEKNTDEIQSIDKDIYSAIHDYLLEKQRELRKIKGDQGEDSSEYEKKRVYFRNVKKVVRELYEKRERKILSLAVDKTRIDSNIIDTTNLLESEKEFFEKTTSLLKSQKHSSIGEILSLKSNGVEKTKVSSSESLGGSDPVSDTSAPKPSTDKGEKEEDKSKNSSREQSGEKRTPGEEDDKKKETNIKQQSAKDSTGKNSSSKEGSPQESSNSISHEKVKVKFISSVPEFLGPELESYGPFEEGESSSLPAEVVEILSKKGRVEKIAETNS